MTITRPPAERAGEKPSRGGSGPHESGSAISVAPKFARGSLPLSRLHISETVPDSPDELAGASRADLQGRRAGTAEVTELVRVSAGRCRKPKSSEGDSDTGQDVRDHLG